MGRRYVTLDYIDPHTGRELTVDPGDYEDHDQGVIDLWCPGCRTPESRCRPPGCCDTCAERATTCPSGRHQAGFGDLDHERGTCDCRTTRNAHRDAS
ncbi:hypothetical protein ACI3EY_16785 [Ornithinimicrobium sp. LYQ92]|uniref:hypothetical protein n=1 Tax=Serinicoccus sp. LYQ92 TaxID=3378798 RepID=UPI003852DA9C